MTSSDELGPLPKAHANAALQRQSLSAFNAVLEHEHLVVRDERFEDYGVDASVEIIAGGAATNFRAQIQIKGRTNLKPNADGSFSVPIASSNLNYLLNGWCAFYVLYRPEAEELRYVFALEEEKRITAIVPEWKDQEHVSIRFADVLDAAALKLIRDRILSESKLHRKLRDNLSRLTPGATTQLRIDPARLTIDSPEQAAKMLLTHGMTLVAEGLAAKVLELVRLLRPEQLKAEPKLHLVQGYAEFFSRNYLRAEPHLRHALLAQEKLADDDRRFLAFLVNAVELSAGHIDNETFRARSDAWRAEAPPHLAIQYDILHLWMKQSEARSPEKLKSTLGELRRTFDRAKTEPTVPVAVRQSARVLELFITAQDRAESLGQALVMSGEPELWSRVYRTDPQTVLSAEFSRVADWRDAFSKLVSEIADSRNGPLLCEACLSRDLAEGFLLTQLRNAAAMRGAPMPPVPEALFVQVRETRDLALHLDQIEIQLRALLAESDLEDMRGNTKGADELSEAAHSKATILRYADIERAARRQLQGEGRSSRTVAEISALRASGFAAAVAAQSDEQLEEQACYGCRTLGIPDARFPTLLEVGRAARAVAREQLSWCRHLELMEVGADQSKDGLYRRLPDRGCRCSRYGHRSAIPSPEWRHVIDAFKRANCSSCSGREPLE